MLHRRYEGRTNGTREQHSVAYALVMIRYHGNYSLSSDLFPNVCVNTGTSIPHHLHIVSTVLTQLLDKTTEMVGLQRRGTTGDGEASMKRESRGKLRGYHQLWS